MGKYLKEYLMKSNLKGWSNFFGQMEEYMKENSVKTKLMETDK